MRDWVLVLLGGMKAVVGAGSFLDRETLNQNTELVNDSLAHFVAVNVQDVPEVRQSNRVSFPKLQEEDCLRRQDKQNQRV